VWWGRLVAEAESCGSIARTALRRGVNAKTLSWWRWTLRREEAPTAEARLLPIAIADGPLPETATRPIEIVIRDDVALRVPLGSDVSYVAALVAAVRSAC
jgi:hypothetical protein